MIDVHIDLFTKIFTTGELIAMDEKMFNVINRLMNDKMAVRLKEFFKSVEDLGILEHDDPFAELIKEKVESLHRILDFNIRCNTFHLEVEERNLFELVQNLDIETALQVITDRQKTRADIQWLLDNRQYWKSQIYGRESADFKVFKELVEELPFVYNSIRSQMQYQGFDFDVPHYPDVVARVKANREFFYEPHERTRSTKMGIIFAKADTLKSILHGLEYQEECDKSNIPVIYRRLLLGGK